MRCNSLHPGNMDIPMLQGVRETVPENRPDAVKSMDSVCVGEPVDIANMVLFHASDDSRSVNGAQMVVGNTTKITEGFVTRA